MGEMKQPSRQRLYQLEHKAKGLCVQCPNPRGISKIHCAECLLKRRTRKRQELGYKPWQRGSRGRTPLEAKNEAA